MFHFHKIDLMIYEYFKVITKSIINLIKMNFIEIVFTKIDNFFILIVSQFSK